MVSAVFSVLGKALAPFTGNLLKDWAASVELGNNVSALELELLSVQALLEPTLGKEIDNLALKDILVMLQDLGYDAEDLLDELDYFRIQDDLDGTLCAHNLALNLKAVVKHIICLPACLSATTSGAKANRGVNGWKAKLTCRSCFKPIHTVSKNIPCSSLPYVPGDDNSTHDSRQRNLADEPSKLRFNRVDASKRIQHIIEQLQLMQQKGFWHYYNIRF